MAEKQSTETTQSPTNKSPKKEANNRTEKETEKEAAAGPSKEAGSEAPPPSAAPEDEEIGAFKKIFLKIGQSVGTVKTTEFGEEYKIAIDEVDTYKKFLAYVLTSATSCIQQNAAFLPPADKIGPTIRTSIDAPSGEDPYEKLAKALDIYATVSSHPKETQTLVKISKNLAKIHRKYQEAAQKTMHQIRHFLKTDIEAIQVQREKVNKYRQEMDFAKHEMEGSQTPGKTRAFEKTKKVYEAQCQKVIKIVRDMTEKRQKHQVEVLNLLKEMKEFHEAASAECQKTRYTFEKLADETTKLQKQANFSMNDDSQK